VITVAVLEHTGTRALKVEAAEVVSVLGAPSSGKTRLALELAFLMRPEQGEVLFHGVNPLARKSRFEPTQRPREVTLLVQNAEDQLFAKTVFDDVAFGPRHLTFSDGGIEGRVVRALEAVRLDVDEVRDRSPFALSGGERRRVALAGVLAMEPEVLILDEPTANLDPQTRNDFLDLLDPLRGKSAIVWLTTRARETALADRIYLLRDGRTVEVHGGADLLRNWRELASAGVELPTVYELAFALERCGHSLPSTASAGELQQAIVRDWQERHRDR
jgi:energy-coupling factor transport system ATP-binding protein